MRPRRLFSLILLVLAPVTLLTLFSLGTSDASQYAPEPPNTGPWLDSTATGANPQSTIEFNLPIPSANFSALVTMGDPGFTIAADADIANGAVMGTVIASPTTLGLAGTPCNNTAFIPTFAMMEATTSQAAADAIAPAGPATDLLRNLAQDDDGDGVAEASDSNGLPNHVDHYPTYLKTLLDPDLPGSGLPAITPKARISGFDSVANTTVILQVLFFEPGALRVLPNAGAHTAALGHPNFVVLQDPTLPPANSNISDFCTALGSVTILHGKAHDNLCTAAVPSCSPIILGGVTQIRGVDGGCPGASTPDESGGGACSNRLTNPASARTVHTIHQTFSQRDFDGDGIENNLDPCPRSWSDPDGIPDTDTTDHMNQRGVSDAANDFDNDGLDKSCDPNDAAAAGNDHDGDAWLNRLDNCGAVKNGGARTLNNTKTLRERHVDSTVNGDYDAGEEIWLDNQVSPDPGAGFVSAGDTILFDIDGTPTVQNGTVPLILFDSVETIAGASVAAPYERHVDTDTTDTQAGRYKVTATDNGGTVNDLREAIVRDVNDNRVFNLGTDVVLAGTPVDGALLIGFLPQTKHISVNDTSGIQTGDNVTIGPFSSGATKTEYDRNGVTVARTGLGGIVSWEGTAQLSTGHPSEPTVAAMAPVTIKFSANVNRGQADFDVAYPLQVEDGGSRNDVIGPPSDADVGCDVTADAVGPLGNPIWGTSGPGFTASLAVTDAGGPDGHYHRTATITRMCISNNQAADDPDGDGVCGPTAAAGDLEEPAAVDCAGGVNDSDCDNDGLSDRIDNCIKDPNPAPAGFSQPDKDQDGIGDKCDGFNDSDGDGFSDRLESNGEEGTFCNNSTDDDADAGAINDGCPRAGAAETDCAAGEGAPLDDDSDTFVNDGCPVVSFSGGAGTLANVHCAGPIVTGSTRTSSQPANSNPADFNGDNFVDVTDIGEVAGSFGTVGTERKDIGPDSPSSLGGGQGDSFVDITDIGAVAGRFGTPSC